jgi:DNA-directed RNA polymerase specialized sigma24 family protein
MAALPLDHLAERAARGEVDAWDTLWCVLYGQMRALAVSKGLGFQDAEEVAATALYKAYERLRARPDDAAGFLGWVRTVTNNEAIDHWWAQHNGRRDANRTVSLEGPGDDDEYRGPAAYLHARVPGPEEVVIWRETLREEWERVRRSRSPNPARIFAAFMTQGEMTQTELAEYLGIPLGSVKTAFRIGRRQERYRPAWA